MEKGDLFFACVEMKYSAQNQYQTAVIKGVDAYDRMLLPQPAAYYADIEKFVQKTQKSYPRCKLLTVDTWEGEKDFHLTINNSQGALVRITVRKVLRQYTPGQHKQNLIIFNDTEQ